MQVFIFMRITTAAVLALRIKNLCHIDVWRQCPGDVLYGRIVCYMLGLDPFIIPLHIPNGSEMGTTIIKSQVNFKTNVSNL